MSLVKQRHITLAAAGLVALWAPIALSDPQPDTPPIAGVDPVRPIHIAPPSPPQVSIARAPFLDPGGLQYAGDPGTMGDMTSGEAPLPPLPPPPQLVGTATGPRGKAVALVKGAGGAVETLARGEAIDGWTLASIGRGEARFTQRGETHVAAITNAPGPTALAGSSQDISQ